MTMTNLSLSDVRFDDDRNLAHCVAYLNRASSWVGFDTSQFLQPCVNKDRVLTGFYSTKYHFGFTVFNHTLDETLNSPFAVSPVTFSEFREWALAQT